MSALARFPVDTEALETHGDLDFSAVMAYMEEASSKRDEPIYGKMKRPGVGWECQHPDVDVELSVAGCERNWLYPKIGQGA